MTNIGGKNYTDVGNSSSPLLLKSNGSIKLAWGNKFIDLIKNGKIAAEAPELIKEVSSINDIRGNGIYIIGSEVWVSINGTNLNLGVSGTISFLQDLELNAEEKYRALKNIGFYYDSLEDVQAARINSGIVYTEGQLYTISNGVIQQFNISSPNGNIEEMNNLLLQVGGTIYIKMLDEIISLQLTTQIATNKMFKSVGANHERGFRLYSSDNWSTLEIDSIKWRNKELEIDSILLFGSNTSIKVLDGASEIPEGWEEVPSIKYIKKVNGNG